MRLALRKLTTRSAAAVHLRKAGVTRTVVRAWIREGGATKQFYSALGSGGTTPGIAVAPVDGSGQAFVSGRVNSSSSVAVTSRYAVVTVTGGVAPYTHAWSQVSGDAMTATDPTSDVSAFTASVAPGTTLNSVWKDTVTDASGKSADSPTVNVSLGNLGGTL